jgi:hypothetical protein
MRHEFGKAPTEAWITQMARNAADETSGGLKAAQNFVS